MKKSLTDKKKYPAVCEYCVNGRLSADKKSVLCEHSGIRKLDSKCRKYKYDPLKRTPKKALQIEKFTEEDFSID